MTTIEQQFQWYRDHQDELVGKYNEKFIVIKDEKVIGVYNSDKDAYIEASKTNELGTFLIQHCLPNMESQAQVFRSRVIFR
jgi:hypothetical protein